MSKSNEQQANQLPGEPRDDELDARPGEDHVSFLKSAESQPESQPPNRSVVCIETSTAYQSPTAAARAVGLNASAPLNTRPNDKRESSDGYRWRYATDEEIAAGRCLTDPVDSLPTVTRGRKPIPVVCVETATMYGSQVDAARGVGLKTSAPISDCMKGNVKSAGGYHWRRATDEEIAAGRCLSEAAEDLPAVTRGRTPIPVVCVETATMYPSILKASKVLGLKASTGINTCLAGKTKSAAGYHWRYATDEEIAAGRCLTEPVDGLPFATRGRKSLPIVCVETATMYRSTRDAARAMGLKTCDSFTACLRGRTKTAAGYHWRRANDEEIAAGRCLSDPVTNLPEARKHKRPVVCRDTATMYESQTAAAKAVGLKGSSSISACLSGKKKSAGGYHWRYAADEEIAAGRCLSNSVTDLPKTMKGSPVVCMETATMYPSGVAAAKAVGLRDISACLAGKTKSAAGYHWRYATDDEIAAGRCLSEPMTDLPEAKKCKRPVVCMETATLYPTIKDAAKTLGLKTGTPISACLRGERKTAGGYHWRYATDKEVTAGRCLSEPIMNLLEARKHKRPVVCMEIAVMYPTRTDAAKAVGLRAPSSIGDCLRGKTKTAGGYHWRYATGEEIAAGRCLSGPVIDLPKTMKGSPVVCMETATMYESIASAAKALGLKTGTPISSCLSGKTKSAGGYHWRYATDEEIEAGRCLSEPVTDLPKTERKSPVVCRDTATMYPSQVDAARAVGLKTSAPISVCLIGKKKTAGGYHWRLATDEEIEAGRCLSEAVEDLPPVTRGRTPIPVVCMETAVMYESQTVAAKAVGLTYSSSISACLRGKKEFAAGYHWRYATDEEIAAGHAMTDEDQE